MEIRAVESGEELAVQVSIHNAVRPYDAIAVEDAEAYRRSLQDHLALLAWEDGSATGGALVAIHPQRRAPQLELWVLPDERRRGIGSRLFAAVSDWARDRDQHELEAWVDEQQPQGQEFVRKRGFSEIGREFGLELDLRSFEPPTVEPPDGIEIVRWSERPDVVCGLYEVACECYPDIPGEEENEMESFEDWLEHDMSSPGDKPEATFVALSGDEVVGYSKFSLTTAQPKVAHHDLTGVKRAWRGRGVASALKSAQIQWAREAGYERLMTANEERNTPVRRLNKRFGYTPAPGQILFRGPISAT